MSNIKNLKPFTKFFLILNDNVTGCDKATELDADCMIMINRDGIFTFPVVTWTGDLYVYVTDTRQNSAENALDFIRNKHSNESTVFSADIDKENRLINVGMQDENQRPVEFAKILKPYYFN